MIELHGTRGSIENRYRGLQMLLRLVIRIRRNSQLFEHAPLLSKTDLYLEKGDSTVSFFNHETGQKELYPDPGYFELLHSGKGGRPKLGKEILQQFYNHNMLQKVGFFKRPFITVLLRNRGAEDNTYYNQVRCSGPQKKLSECRASFCPIRFSCGGNG